MQTADERRAGAIELIRATTVSVATRRAHAAGAFTRALTAVEDSAALMDRSDAALRAVAQMLAASRRKTSTLSDQHP
jgi:hypothetical protein